MYNNIGRKIKGLSIAFYIIGAAVPAIIGCIMIASDSDLVTAGFIVIVVGCIAAWISSWLLYGFGELIENTGHIAANSRNIQKILEDKNIPVTDYSTENTMIGKQLTEAFADLFKRSYYGRGICGTQCGIYQQIFHEKYITMSFSTYIVKIIL